MSERIEQYSRRNNLRIENITEIQGENTDELLINFAEEKLKMKLEKRDIDRIHRVGDPKKKQNRALIVKFTSYNVRREFYKRRTQLRNLPGQKIWINEDLTKQRFGLYYEARKMVKDKLLHKTWTMDGKIFTMKHENDKPIIVTTMHKLQSL